MRPTTSPTTKTKFNLVLVIWLTLQVTFLSSQTMLQTPPGSGTIEHPYEISTLGHLSWMTQTPSSWEKHFIQVADILAYQTEFWDLDDGNGDGDLFNDQNDGTDLGANEGFDPIGGIFTGSFDGQGYAIVGLTSSGQVATLFSEIDGDYQISNVNLYNISSNGAGIAALTKVPIQNCHVTGNLESSNSFGAGGLVTQSESDISNCSFIGSLTSAGGATGGLVGLNFNGNITECYARSILQHGDVPSPIGITSGLNTLGGLVGFNTGGEVSFSYALSDLQSSSSCLGGVVGENSLNGDVFQVYSGSLDKEYYNKNFAVGCKNSALGNNFFGINTSNPKWEQDDNENGGMVHLHWQLFETKLYLDKAQKVEKTSAVFKGSLGTMEFGAVFDKYGLVYGTSPNPVITNGQITEEGPIEAVRRFNLELNGLQPGTTYFVRPYVTNANEMVYGNEVTFTTKIQPESFLQPLGAGSENDPYRISNLQELLWLSQNLESWDDFFVQTADIDAVNTQFWDASDDNGDGDPYNDPDDATLSGANDGFPPIGNEMVRFEGTYSGGQFKISNLFINNTQDNSGLFGITGINASLSDIRIIDCEINGNRFVGGLVGVSWSSIRNVSITGFVSGAHFVGGLAGLNGIENVGTSDDLPLIHSGSVENSYVDVTVSGQDYVGGLVGANSAIVQNSYSLGAVNGRSAVGGLTGLNSGVVTNSYSNGAVSGESDLGGLIGILAFTDPVYGLDTTPATTNSFWNTTTANQTTSADGSGHDDVAMKLQSTFVGWDFDTIWAMDGMNNDGYPYLRWQVFFPEITSDELLGVAPTQFTVKGTIANLGFPTITNFGFQLSNEPDFAETDTFMQQEEVQVGEFELSIDALQPGTTYYVRAVAWQGTEVFFAEPLMVTTVTDNEAPTPSLQNLPQVTNETFVLELVFDEQVVNLVENPIFLAPARDGSVMATLGQVLTITEGLEYHIEVTPVLAGELVFYYSATGMAEDLAGNLSNPLPEQSVVYDPFTLPPIVQTPLDNSMGNGILLDFNLPENAKEGSVTLKIEPADQASAQPPISVHFASTVEAMGNYNISLDPTDLDSASEVASVTGPNRLIENVSYNLTLAYSDFMDNPPASFTVFNHIFDNTAPVLLSVGLSSNNDVNSDLATTGDEVYLDFESDEFLTATAVYINGENIFTTTVEDNIKRATLPVLENTREGPVTFEIFAIDATGNEVQVSATTDGSSVEIDKTPPTTEWITISSNNPSIIYAKADDEIYLDFETDEPLSEVIGNINATKVNYQYLGANKWRGTLLIDGNAFEGDSFFELLLIDQVGNSTMVDMTSDNSFVFTDITPPTVLTRDLTIELIEGETRSITQNDIDNGSSDNCGSVTYELDKSVFGMADIGRQVVTMTLTDCAGNSASETANVNVVLFTNDDDGDGVLDNEDQCPNTPNGVIVDSIGCELTAMDEDDFLIKILSPSCIEVPNGSVAITALFTQGNYHVNLNGNETFSLNANDGYSSILEGLGPGSHTICIHQINDPEIELCFEIVIPELDIIGVQTMVDDENQELVLELSGSTNYTINWNGEVQSVNERDIRLPLDIGRNVLSVSGLFECQGTYEDYVDFSSEVISYPNPTKDWINVFIPGSDFKIKAVLTSIKGSTVYSNVIPVPKNRWIRLYLGGNTDGTYILYLENETVDEQIMIIKR